MPQGESRPPARHVAVIGAGVIGMGCAAYLQRDGHRVTVIDRLPPGMACSWGNTGGLGVSSIPPISMPGVAAKVPKWLLDPTGPLALRWGHLPRLLPWLVRFIRAGRLDRVEAITDALAALFAPSYEAWEPLFQAAGLGNLVHHSGVLHLYPDRAAFEADSLQWKLRTDRGFPFETLDRAALVAREPDIGPARAFAVYEASWRRVADPYRIVKGLAEHFVREGGIIREAEVTGFEAADGAVRAARLGGERIEADIFVIAAGAWSHRLSARLGDPAPLESQRGYHVTFPAPGVAVRHLLLDSVAKMAVTPMEMGLRAGGTSEFAGVDAPPDWRRAEALVAWSRALFPTLETAGYTRWAGDRPLLPDSLPAIGPSPAFANVQYAFGHSHAGLALGGMTGRLIAGLVAGRAPEIDLAPYRIDRF